MRNKSMRISKKFSIAVLSTALLFSGCSKTSNNNNEVPTPEEKLENTIHTEPTASPEEVTNDSNSNTSGIENTNDPTTPEPTTVETQDLKEIVQQIIDDSSNDYPTNVEIMDVVSGDIGNDGEQDIAAVLQYKDTTNGPAEDQPFSRILCIFTKENDKYVLSNRNNKLVPSSDEGGVFGDPYEGIAIKDGQFSLSTYGGSSDRWGYVHTFEVMDHDLVLVKILNDNMSTLTQNGTETIYDFVNGTVETYSYSESQENYVPLIIYRGIFKAELQSFSEANDYPIPDIKISPQCPMPSLSYYDYFGVMDDSIHKYQGNLNYGAEAILDLVKDKYYPDMKKVVLSCDKEILDNYSTLLGYEVPGYYYENNDGKLTYFDLEFHQGYSKWEHTVMFSGIKNDDDKFYWLWDDTGEEENFDKE